MNGWGCSNMEFLSFKLNKTLFGILLDKVKEIVKETKVTPVPLTPYYIEGVMNLRGEPTSIIDLKKKLGFEIKAKSTDIILCYIKDSIVGLKVDKILNIHKYSHKDFKEVSSSIKEDIESKYVKGIVQIEEDKYLIIDVDNLI
jgi:purine-binding chemotaxis protein CheW